MKFDHIIFVGMNFQMARSTGDKNFWVDLIHQLSGQGRRISIISVRREAQRRREYRIGSGLVRVRYLSPVFLESSQAEYDRPRIFWRQGVFPKRLGVVEKTLSGIRILRELKKMGQDDPGPRIHLMDNFGFLNRVIASATRAKVSVSAMAYQGNNASLYNRYLLLSYNHPRLTVVPYSSAFAVKLRQIGIAPARIAPIPWGVKVPLQPPPAENRARAKKALSLPGDKPLFLWAGYIQQIQREDFLLALRVAREARGRNLNAIFYFAFKPESMEKGFASLNDPEKGLLVAATAVEKFSLLKDAADVFYSPLVNRDCVVAPPLTWLEVLSLGVPILTTDAGGVSEIIDEGRTGYVAGSEDELLSKIFIVRRRYGEMIRDCHERILNSYNIERTAEKYLNLWA